jgi:hypothetical protein
MKATSKADIEAVLLELVAAGYSVTVAGTDAKGQTGKRPLGKEWQKRPITTTQGVLDAVDDAAVTGGGVIGLSAIDIDGPEAATLFEAETVRLHIAASDFDTPMKVQTGRGEGFEHWWYQPDDEVSNAGGICALIDGVDVRGRGGYLCFVALGRDYTPLNGLVPLAELPSAPKWIKGRAKRVAGGIEVLPTRSSWEPETTDYGRDRFNDALRQIGWAKIGGRHDAVYKAAYQGGHLICEGNLESVELLRSEIVRIAEQSHLYAEGRGREVSQTITDGLLASLGVRQQYLTDQIVVVESWTE